MLLPQTRGELGHSSSGILADALQNIDEVGVRIDAVQTAGDDQTLHDADLLSAQFSPGEKPIAPAHGNYTQRTLQVIRVHRHFGVAEKYLQSHAPLAHVAQCLREWTAWQQPLPLELLVDPLERNETQTPTDFSAKPEICVTFVQRDRGISIGR